MISQLPAKPVVVPSLDEIARDSRRATGLPKATLASLLRRCAAAQSALVAEIDEVTRDDQAVVAQDDDQMLTVEEAATVLRRSRQWIYRNAAHLPFVKRISRKSLLCSRIGIARWLARKTVWRQGSDGLCLNYAQIDDSVVRGAD